MVRKCRHRAATIPRSPNPEAPAPAVSASPPLGLAHPDRRPGAGDQATDAAGVAASRGASNGGPSACARSVAWWLTCMAAGWFSTRERGRSVRPAAATMRITSDSQLGAILLLFFMSVRRGRCSRSRSPLAALLCNFIHASSQTSSDRPRPSPSASVV